MDVEKLYLQKKITMPAFISDGASLTPTAPMSVGFSGNGTQWDLVSKNNLSVTGLFSATPGLNYPYPTKTLLVFHKENDQKIFCELQDIKGGDLLAYNHGTQADMNAAILAAGHWITSI